MTGDNIVELNSALPKKRSKGDLLATALLIIGTILCVVCALALAAIILAGVVGGAVRAWQWAV